MKARMENGEYECEKQGIERAQTETTTISRNEGKKIQHHIRWLRGMVLRVRERVVDLLLTHLAS